MSLALRLDGRLPPRLAAQAQRIEGLARTAGLDFYPVAFQLLDARDVNGVAALGGFPVRYPSWRHGMEFERLEKGHAWGLSKIYELVVNTDPVVAYLVRSNSDLEQKLVMAHVFGHADFFRHNCWFASTDRGMLETMAHHATLVRRHIDVQGLEAVERCLDLVLSLENLIDPYLPLRQRLRAGEPLAEGALGFDVLGFLQEAAPLADWQRDIVRIVRAEAYYFQPQRMTRIMNEGWASFWHSRLLTGGALDASEIVDFADCHSGATQEVPGRLNPYKLGIELWRHAEERGEDLFRLRRVHNDASFLDELLDQDFAERSRLFLFTHNARSGRAEIEGRDVDRIKERLLQDLAWGGLPRIELCDVEGRDGERALVLRHHHDGRDLELAQARETLLRLSRLWSGPVRLDTSEGGVAKRLTCAGGEVEIQDLAERPTHPREGGGAGASERGS